MAERRMFAKTIIDSDAFIDMPLSTQALYFHLSMRADDDGFINNSKKIQRMVGCSDDDMKLLIAKNFIIPFESGIIVIKHWKIHNYIRGDRKRRTVYPEEMALLTEKDNGAYSLISDEQFDECQANVRQMTDKCPSNDRQLTGKCQHRIGEYSIVEDSIEVVEDNIKNNVADYVHQIIDYLNLKIGARYRPNSKSTQSHIKARLKEGYSLQDFLTVIDKKCSEWRGTNMEQYLRPETLFGTKFEGYLNSKVNPVANQPQQQGTGNIFVDMLIEEGYINE